MSLSGGRARKTKRTPKSSESGSGRREEGVKKRGFLKFAINLN